MALDDAIQRLIDQLARIPGLGPRSARRAVIHLLEKRPETIVPLAESLMILAKTVQKCTICGNIATDETCLICTDPKRDGRVICVLEGISDLWALERAHFFKGHYHVLGGVLSAFDGVGPDKLRLPHLLERIQKNAVEEVVLALGATLDGQTTAHYIQNAIAPLGVRVTMIAKGIPLGSELDYLDDGTLETAFRARA